MDVDTSSSYTRVDREPQYHSNIHFFTNGGRSVYTRLLNILKIIYWYGVFPTIICVSLSGLMVMGICLVLLPCVLLVSFLYVPTILLGSKHSSLQVLGIPFDILLAYIFIGLWGLIIIIIVIYVLIACREFIYNYREKVLRKVITILWMYLFIILAVILLSVDVPIMLIKILYIGCYQVVDIIMRVLYIAGFVCGCSECIPANMSEVSCCQCMDNLTIH